MLTALILVAIIAILFALPRLTVARFEKIVLSEPPSNQRVVARTVLNTAKACGIPGARKLRERIVKLRDKHLEAFHSTAEAIRQLESKRFEHSERATSMRDLADLV